jgi:hypothetical protein
MCAYIQWIMVLITVLALCTPGTCARGYIAVFPEESAAAREARHARIAERRKGPIVIVHRGASSFAPENTLEAYAAAIDYGADGCEIDPRRTADGVIVLFHDDMLENLTNGFGSVNQLTYYELLQLKRRSVYGTATRETGIPTLVSLLELARERAMLLHLDLKEPGMAADIAKLLDDADMWDSVVALNMDNAGDLLTNPKLKLLSYKAPGLYEDRSDVDEAAVRDALAKPGEMIIVDDPRTAARVLHRPAYQPAPIPKTLRRDWPPLHLPDVPNADEFAPNKYVAKLTAKSVEQLSRLLDRSDAGRADTDGDVKAQRPRREKMLARAWAAERLAETGKKTDDVVRLLEYQVQHRSLDRDWRYHGVDGASAVRALAALHATESVPVLVNALMHVDPRLSKAVNPEFPDTPVAYYDWRVKTAIMQALGDLPCDAAKRALLAYLKLDEESARKLCIPLYADATRSLLKQKLSVSEIRELLQSPNRTIRGTAIPECLDRPNKQRTQAMSAVPWALDLPHAKQR